MKLSKIISKMEAVSEYSGRIFVWLAIPLTSLVVYEVISRRILGSPHVWSTEVIDYFYGSHFMLVAAYTFLYKAHVSIDIIYGKFSSRVQGILDVITYLVFFFPFCTLVLYNGILYAYTSWSIHETSESAALKVVPLVKTVIPVTFALLINQGIVNFIKAIYKLVKGVEI